MKSTQNSSRQSIDETLEIRTLRVALSTSYDMNELRVLASDMSVDWDNIAGETKDVKVTELIKFMKRRGTLSRLINTVNEDRGDLLSSYQVGI